MELKRGILTLLQSRKSKEKLQNNQQPHQTKKQNKKHNLPPTSSGIDTPIRPRTITQFLNKIIELIPS